MLDVPSAQGKTLGGAWFLCSMPLPRSVLLFIVHEACLFVQPHILHLVLSLHAAQVRAEGAGSLAWAVHRMRCDKSTTRAPAWSSCRVSEFRLSDVPTKALLLHVITGRPPCSIAATL